jgi:hypothetical protein
MEKFQSGPPGGLTLPQTPTRLSDLVGGVYGPGASVASTGLNTHRPAIKAGLARAAGETWEDVLEYYLVRILFLPTILTMYNGVFSSTRIEEKLISLIVLARSFIKGASTQPLVESGLAAKVLVPSQEILNSLASISS